MITIENRNPVLTEQEKHSQRQTIEHGLFEIFIKYEKEQSNKDSYIRVATV